MMLSLVLAAFFFSPSHPGGLKPAMTTGDMQTDWQKYSATADSIVVDTVPTRNILASWKLMGVKVLKRVAWNPDDSAEYIRRKAGFLAVRAGADGVWLEGEKKFPKAWKEALAEAKVDAEIMSYLLELGERAKTMRDVNHKLWIEGRRANWFVTTLLPCWTGNLDAIRLDCLEYVSRLEQLLDVKNPKKFPYAVAKPSKEPDRAPIRPFEGEDVQKFNLSPFSGETKLSDEVTLKCQGLGFNIFIHTKKPCKDAEYPGGRSHFKIYMSDGKGSYLPYEYVMDLSPVDMNRAPDSGTFLKERWDKGCLWVWGDTSTWRFKTVYHQTSGPDYPELSPRFRFLPDKKTGLWTIEIWVSWNTLYGFWPAARDGVYDKWFISLDALPGVEPMKAQINWGKGKSANFDAFANASWEKARFINSRWCGVRDGAMGLYNFSYSDRLYGFLPTKTPTYQCLDVESDKIFKERVAQPMLDEVASIADAILVNNSDRRVAKFDKMPPGPKKKLFRSLEKLFSFGKRLSEARRDYLLLRHEGKMPPEYKPKKAKAEAAADTMPNIDSTDGEIQLDDEMEF